jgi:hypothetical protein
MAALAANAPQKSLTVAPGTIQAATKSASADATQATRRRRGRSFGRAGLQVADRPKAGWVVVVIARPAPQRFSTTGS